VPASSNQTCHRLIALLSTPLSSLIPHTISCATDGESAWRRPESALSALRSPASALPDEPPPFAQGPGLPAHQRVLGRRGPRPRRDRGGWRCGHRRRRTVPPAVLVSVGIVATGGDVIVRAIHATPGAQAGHPSGRCHQVRCRGNATGVMCCFVLFRQGFCLGFNIIHWSIRWDIKQQHSLTW
jgi:hypothetical protein